MSPRRKRTSEDGEIIFYRKGHSIEKLAVIVSRNLRKRFGRIQALRGVTFSVSKGSATALLGPNGAGKTTTLKILLGLLKPDSGEVEVFGMDPWRKGDKIRGIVGVLHEKPVYPQWASVRQLIRYAARLRGLGEMDEERAIKLSGLERYAGARISSLSRGYLQRLGIALAILGDPELLLLDEPTANLDPAARMEILNLISVLKEELDVTVLISSHIIPELEMVCDSAIFINEGLVLDQGSLDELARKHNSRAVVVIRTRDPRKLASDLIGRDYVKSVEVSSESVKVEVMPGELPTLESEISRLGGKYGIERVESAAGRLQDLYWKVIGVAR